MCTWSWMCMSVGVCVYIHVCVHLVVRSQTWVSFLRSCPFYLFLPFIIFILCVWVFPLIVCMQCPRRSEEAVWITDSCGFSCGCREPNWGLLEGQPLFLTTEPLLQPLFIYFLETRFLTGTWGSQKWLGFPYTMWALRIELKSSGLFIN